MDERGGVVPVNSDKKASKRRFLLFRRRRKRPSDDSLPYESDTPKVTNSMIESETSEMDITGLSMCPSEALQINGDASNAPPAVPKGDAEKLSIQAAETTDMNKVTARSVCTFCNCVYVARFGPKQPCALVLMLRAYARCGPLRDYLVGLHPNSQL